MKSNEFKKWANMAKTSSAKAVEDRINTITSRYDIGKQILKKCGPRSPLDAIDKMAIEFDINGETVRKLRAMANPEIGYTESELNQWFREFRKAGFSLTITHFIKLISVPKGRKRDALTRQAIKQKWSSHLLQAEILALQGRRKAAGRPPKYVGGKNFEQKLSQTLWSWSRWLGIQLEEDESMRSEIAKELKSLQLKIRRLQTSLDVE